MQSTIGKGFNKPAGARKLFAFLCVFAFYTLLLQ